MYHIPFYIKSGKWMKTPGSKSNCVFSVLSAFVDWRTIILFLFMNFSKCFAAPIPFGISHKHICIWNTWTHFAILQFHSYSLSLSANPIYLWDRRKRGRRMRLLYWEINFPFRVIQTFKEKQVILWGERNTEISNYCSSIITNNKEELKSKAAFA